MSCPANLEYPEYIKSIIKQINAENNNQLKSCLCANNSTPLDDQGCPILDEDGKVGLFPFCVPIVEDGVGDDTDYPIKLTLKQAMNLYWKVNSWNLVASDITVGCGTCTYYVDFNGNRMIDGVSGSQPPLMKERVCQKIHTFLTNALVKTCCSGTIPPCNTNNITDMTVASLFDYNDKPAMKCKKEGETYYFYPSFAIYLVHYSVSAAENQLAADEALGEGPVEPMQSLTVSVRIIDDNINFRYYRSKWASSEGPPPCSYNPTMNISKLEFNS